MAEVPAGLLLLARPALRAIREHAEAAWPHEGCGLLEGHANGRVTRVRRAIPCHNEHEQPAQRYRIDPERFLRADRAAERIGRRIVGVWHSHPNGTTCFSETDRRQAWPGWHYLVAAVDAGRMRALRDWYVLGAAAGPGRIVLLR